MPATDLRDMEIDCDRCRELVSAAADDELAEGEDAILAAHLAACRDCTRYADRVAALNRAVRIRAVGPRSDVVDAVVAAHRPRLGRGAWVRPALAWVGVVVAVQSIAPLVLGELDGAPTHVARHVGASSLALATGFVFVAWRPHRAAGLLPLVAALFAATALAALFDTVAGDRRAGAEVVHAGELVGMVLVWLTAGSPGWERFTAAVWHRSGPPHGLRPR